MGGGDRGEGQREETGEMGEIGRNLDRGGIGMQGGEGREVEDRERIGRN